MVSVIIPTFNNPGELIRAVASVTNQTYNSIEIIIIDDGSSVDYAETIACLHKMSRFNIKYYKKDNEGPGVARQYALNLAEGIFFQYLDSDDELMPNKIKKQVELLENHPDIVMTYGLSMINSNPNHIHRSKHSRNRCDNLAESALGKRKWHTSSCLWKYPKGTYWEDLYNGEDVLHDVNVGIKYKNKILFIEEIVSNINFDNSIKHLSNRHLDTKNKYRLVKDSIDLNLRLYSLLLPRLRMGDERYSEPLAERFLHTGCKLATWGYRTEADFLFKGGRKIKCSKLKNIEFVIARLINSYPLNGRNALIKLFFKLHKYITGVDVHHYRRV